MSKDQPPPELRFTGLMSLAALLFAGPICAGEITATPDAGQVDLDKLLGQPADVAPSAYFYRADRKPDENPPESWILLAQFANLPFDKPVDVRAPAIQKVLCGLLWEEVRPIRRIELSWPAEVKEVPPPEALELSGFDATDGTAHTWWNPRTIRQADKPQISADGRTYIYAIPVDTWGVVAATPGQKDSSAFVVPRIRALVPEGWKKMDVEIEWGFDQTTAALEYDGRAEAYDGIVSDVRGLNGDIGTTVTGPQA
jgi:hypothetical protein